jgi:methionyl-tRNA formyltransferase
MADREPPIRRRTLFVGDRPLVFEAARRFAELDIEWIWAVAGSALERHLVDLGLPFERFELTERQRLVDALHRTPFDLLLSNGCRAIIPVSSLRQAGRLFLNVHPSPLPDMRGKHPLNGALLFDTGEAGATLHHMTDGIDDGPIISRQSFAITDDLDLGLLYHMVFRLEAEVFARGMSQLIDHGFECPGEPQGPARYYSGRERDRWLDLARMDDLEIVRRVRAFAVRTQGALAVIDGRELKILEARIVSNPILLAESEAAAPGSVVLRYDGRLLVRTRQGLVSLTPLVGRDAPPSRSHARTPEPTLTTRKTKVATR